MKPKINLENPIVKSGIDGIHRQAKIALETRQDVEKAIIPIYAIPKTKAHQKPKTKAEQFGSGILLKIKDQYFILSSTHLFEAFEGNVLLTGDSKGGPIQHLSGERFSTGQIEKPYSNQLDATVFHIQSDLINSLKEKALNIDDLELEDDKEKIKPIYLAAGFRIKKSNIKGNQITSKAEAFPSMEMDLKIYELYNIDKKAQFITAYEDDILEDGKWRKSPVPRGFSGGGLIKIDGTNVLNYGSIPTKTRQKLKAIITEHRRGIHNKPGILISTKINVHIGLIYKFLPELFEN